MDDSMRIQEFEEKPMVANSNTISTGIYVIRRRQLIDLIEHAAQEDRYDFVNDILIRYKNLKRFTDIRSPATGAIFPQQKHTIRQIWIS